MLHSFLYDPAPFNHVAMTISLKLIKMDSDSFVHHLEYLGSSGSILSVEKKTFLQTSLVLVQQEYKFARVKFWGVVKGINRDYHIVHGVGKDAVRNRKGLYRYRPTYTTVLPLPPRYRAGSRGEGVSVDYLMVSVGRFFSIRHIETHTHTQISPISYLELLSLLVYTQSRLYRVEPSASCG